MAVLEARDLELEKLLEHGLLGMRVAQNICFFTIKVGC